MFFKDKGLFFTSLITPVILLVLYATFLSNVYRDSFLLSVPDFLPKARALIDGCVGAQLVSSILSVSAVTVSFCSNMLMVQDKANGTVKDLTISPVKPSALSLAYYVASFVSTLIVCFTAALICFLYMVHVGWYMSFLDVVLLLLDVVLLVLFGTALSSVINFFLSTQAQISAVGSMISSVYGFICGAYMPISQFSEGLQKVLSFLPTTYATSLVKNHSMQGIFRAMEKENYPEEVITSLRDGVDCNIYFLDESVGVSTMFSLIFVTVLVLLSIYVLLNVFYRKKK